MEVAERLYELTNNIDNIGLYDPEKRRKEEEALKIEYHSNIAREEVNDYVSDEDGNLVTYKDRIEDEDGKLLRYEEKPVIFKHKSTVYAKKVKIKKDKGIFKNKSYNFS